MYNQIPWKPGTAAKGFHCEKCNCNGHATSCRYDQDVADRRMSMDIRGKFRGGGVCINCTVSPNFTREISSNEIADTSSICFANVTADDERNAARIFFFIYVCYVESDQHTYKQHCLIL